MGQVCRPLLQPPDLQVAGGDIDTTAIVVVVARDDQSPAGHDENPNESLEAPLM